MAHRKYTRRAAEDVIIFQNKIRIIIMHIVAIIRDIIGLAVLLGIEFIFSNNKKKISWKLVEADFGLH